MGEVRKRKASNEGKTEKAENPVVISEGGGLGLIPVVLIAAILAGSGCYVIKKDHAESFADIETLTLKLKTDNAQILKAVETMKKSIDQKDGIIKELQQKVTAGNEKNRLLEGKLSKMDNTLTETAAQLRGDIESSHTDKFDAISTTIDQLSAGNSKLETRLSDLGESSSESSDTIDATLKLNYDECLNRMKTFEAKFEGQLKSVDLATAEMEEKMGDLNELLKSTEEKLRTDIDAKYDDNMKNIKKYASEVGDHSNNILQSNNRLDKTNDKLDDLIEKIAEGDAAADLRQSQIDTLEKTLESTKEETAAKTEELKTLVQDQTADSGALEIQAAQLTEVTGQIDDLNNKIQEGAQSIAKLNAETVAINAKIENVENISKSATDAIDEIKSTGGAQLDALNAVIPILQEKVDALENTIDDVSNSIPSETLLVTIQAAAQKATDGLTAAVKDISENSHEIQSIKTASQKELADLVARIGSVVTDVKEGGSLTTSLQESIEATNTIIKALTKDIEGLKKRAQKK